MPAEEPYLALCLTLDPVQIADVLLEMRRPDGGALHCSRCMTVSDLTRNILDPVTRLVGLLDEPGDIRFCGAGGAGTALSPVARPQGGCCGRSPPPAAICRI
jgi:hypothetical protein